MEKKRSATGIIVVIIALVLIGGGVIWAINRNNDNTTQPTQSSPSQQPTSGNIVVLAGQTADLSTLVSAVKAANLVDTLQASGPYTVFAPTNAAFAALPAGTLQSLLQPENVEQLKSILTYHVVAGKVMAADLQDGQEITTVQGGKLKVSITDGKVYLIDAKGNKVMVEKADVNADNGVVHIINGVLLPS